MVTCTNPHCEGKHVKILSLSDELCFFSLTNTDGDGI